MSRNFYLQLRSNRRFIGLDLRTGWASNLLGSLSKTIIRSPWRDMEYWKKRDLQKLWEVTGIHSFFCLFSYCYHSLLWCINWYKHLLLFWTYYNLHILHFCGSTFWKRRSSPHDSSSSPNTCGLSWQFSGLLAGPIVSRPPTSASVVCLVPTVPRKGGGSVVESGE